MGDFRNGGREWRPKGRPEEVNVHEFPDKKLGKAAPYGVYDVAHNIGWVNVGISYDTAAFAVESIRRWWLRLGQELYPGASRLLITADCGGSNGARVRLWKVELQELARELGLEITVCHLPPGTSKWNRIEHRLFSFISQNWHQSELARQAAEDRRHHRQLDQRHHNQHRPQSLLRRGRERLSQGRGDRRCPNKCPRHPARGVPWRVELYLLADSSNRRGYCLTNPNVYKAPGSRNLQNCLEPCYCSVSDL